VHQRLAAPVDKHFEHSISDMECTMKRLDVDALLIVLNNRDAVGTPLMYYLHTCLNTLADDWHVTVVAMHF